MKRIISRLEKTRAYFHGKIDKIFYRGARIDSGLLDEIEDVLIQSDLGVSVVNGILQSLRKRKYFDRTEELYELVRQELLAILLQDAGKTSMNYASSGLTVVMVMGVNGSGKTTTISKLAGMKKAENKKIMLAAADTFRAAAIEQLDIWAKSLNVDIVKTSYGADPSSVVFDAVSAAIKRKIDILFIDTAGRFHNKTELMEELKKINRTIQKKYPGAPHEKLLIVDSTTGQNALLQAKQFKETLDITGIVVTKLDGTAKGGVLVGIKKELNIPVKFITTGQDISDIEEFDPREYVEAMI